MQASLLLLSLIRIFASMYRKVIHIIPSRFGRQGAIAAATVLARAVLNFFGIAMLIPLLMLILDGEAFHSQPTLQGIYRALGFSDDRAFVLTVAAVAVAAVASKGAVNILLYRYERDYIYNLYRDLSRRLYIDYYRRGLAFVKRNNSAELSRNVNFVCLRFVTGVLQPAATLVGETLLFLLITGAMFAYAPVAALLLAAIFIPAVALYYRLVRRRMNEYGKIENEAMRENFRNVSEMFRGYADVEINNAFPRMLADFDDSTERLIDMRKRDATMATLPQTVTETAIAIGMAALIAAGICMPSADVRILFGLFAIAALRLMPSVRNILSALTAIRYNRYTADILADMTDTHDAERSTERMRMHRDMVLHDITFGYDDGRDGGVINGFSLRIRRGERIGIKGSSGAGKSTLMNLMLGLYAPQRGEILIDGERLDESNRRAWQNSVGYVPQSVFIADSTLAENVALGEDPEKIDRARVAEALETAALTGFVSGLPQGIDTMIGESGCRISGGERQRIGIARALYRRPDILFFDEATSALDRNTERSINDSIVRLSEYDKELTIVVIAHRDTSLGYCDRIIEIGK